MMKCQHLLAIGSVLSVTLMITRLDCIGRKMFSVLDDDQSLICMPLNANGRILE